MALPLKYNFRNITVRKSSTLATAFTIGLTVGVYLIVLREGSTAELNSTVTRDNLNNLIYLDGVEREGDQPLAAPETLTLIYKARKGMSQGSNVTIRGIGPMSN